jgi:uncharacterized protein (TIGR02466 family)
MNITPVFPDAIGTKENTSVSFNREELLNLLSWKIDRNDLGQFGQSQTNVFEINEWKELHNWILDSAKEFWNSLGYKADGLFFTQSWINVYRSNQAISWHNHSNSLISGVYYFKTDNNAGGTVFQTTKNPLEGILQTEVDHITPYNCGDFVKPAVQDTAIFFPSYMTHSSQPSQFLDSERITLAFNIMPAELGKENYFNWVKF